MAAMGAARAYSTAIKNRLAQASSPYLQSHKSNPVAWQEWDEEALKLAAKEDKPVFLSIGYHTCHWCHVMNKESFSSNQIASLLNENFIPIKVDKEERPDIDAVYMMYLQAMAGQGGWPLNVFLTPDTLEPIFGGTYWAGPGSKTQAAQFEDVLNGVTDVWRSDQEKCRKSAKSVADKLRTLVQAQSEAESASFTSGLMDDVKSHFTSVFDSYNGGFTHAPKFPMPHMLSFMIKYGKYLGGRDGLADKAAFTLSKIGKGGIKDQVGTGFARYSVTEDWSLPHFEKMLYDQGLLLTAYLDGYVLDRQKNEFAKHYAEDIIRFLTAGPLTNPEGGFYSAQDADSLAENGHHAEGAYYVWSYEEFYKALGGHNLDNDMAAMFWGVEEYGNVDPQFDVQKELALQNVLSEASSLKQVAQMYGTSENKVLQVVENARKKLLEYREANRQPPDVDKKIITCWNGLAIGALAKSYRVLRDKKALEAAEAAAKFLKEKSYDPQTQALRRVAGSSTNGMNEDYAYLISGLINLYEATFNHEYLEWAIKLQNTQIRLFWDKENGGFFSVEEENATELLFRPKSGFDAAEPSSNGVSCANLYRLSAILANSEYETYAIGILDCYGKDLTAQPFGYCSMLGSVLARMNGMETVVLVGEDKDGAQFDRVMDSLQSEPRPNSVVIRVDEASIDFFRNIPDTVYGALYDKHSKGGLTGHICKNRSCIPLDLE